MKKSKKMLLRIIPVFLVLTVVLTTTVFGFNNFNTNNMGDLSGNVGGIQTADTAVKKVWSTVTLILQVLAVAAIVFAGVRYMFASADAKADIKKQTIGLVVGAILVFGASMIVNFIVNVTREVTSQAPVYVEKA